MKNAVRETAINSGLFGKINRISMFGSRVTGLARTDSDLDLLIEFSRPVGFFELVILEKQLEVAVGIKVDLVTPRSLSPLLRNNIMNSAESLYEKK